ncbi:NERD domain-containing protein [Bacillus sp. Marseille-Q3570]|uniref:NERD domain-containing protein n=1 Tax=Bacillus sp. Marseille-Q3570 TaxID=2963522 RepID=UPI0021B79F32|nr:NERD domain-containing protein [Bacillus sp. Marseille-Q3570]
MAHLIKLEDCISRYEQDVFRYTGQYTRLKRDRWHRVKTNWENAQETVDLQHGAEDQSDEKKWWKLKGRETEINVIDEGSVKRDDRTFSKLKEDFREELFQFQLKWASSTIRETSRISRSLNRDKFLRFLLKEVPDNYLVLYKPVIKVRKAQTQLDVILLGPDSIQAIVMLETSMGEVVHASQNRFWKCEKEGDERKMVNPISAVQRMNYFIESVIDTEATEMNLTYVILAQNAFVNRTNIPSYVQVIDQTNFDNWKNKLKKQPSPLKFKQLKAAKVILEQCVTTAFSRPEWESDENQGDLKNSE